MSTINIKAVRRDASASLSNKKLAAANINQDDEDEEMLDQSEDVES